MHDHVSLDSVETCCLCLLKTGIGSCEGASEASNPADVATHKSELVQCGCVGLVILLLEGGHAPK